MWDRMVGFAVSPHHTCFGNMVNHSVPMYDEIQRMSCEIAGDFGVEGTNLYDLGCATGTTLIQLDNTLKQGGRFVGVDESHQMLDKAREKIDEHGIERAVDLRRADLHQAPVVENASVVMMVLTLEFMRPLQRERAARWIAEGFMNRGVCFWSRS